MDTECSHVANKVSKCFMRSQKFTHCAINEILVKQTPKGDNSCHLELCISFYLPTIANQSCQTMKSLHSSPRPIKYIGTFASSWSTDANLIFHAIANPCRASLIGSVWRDMGPTGRTLGIPRTFFSMYRKRSTSRLMANIPGSAEMNSLKFPWRSSFHRKL